MSHLLSTIVAAPALAALILLVLPATARTAIRVVSLAAALVSCAGSFLVARDYDRALGGLQMLEDFALVPSLGIHLKLAVDGWGVPLLILTGIIIVAGVLASWSVARRDKDFFVLLLVLVAGVFGVFVAQDLFVFFLFYEIAVLPMYLLIGIWGGKNRDYASMKFFVYTLVGSVAMLLAILGTYLAAGTFDIIGAAAAKPFANLPPDQALLLGSLAFWGLFLGFAFKVPSFPFHTWLPDAHTEAPTAGSVILAGILLKLGGYGMMRMMIPTYPSAAAYWSNWLVALGAIAIVYGALVCIAQTDLKRLIAYSSVSHMGYVIMGIGAAAAAFGALDDPSKFDSAAMAFNGATMQMFNHGLITGALFFLVGVIYERAHTRDLDRFGGLGSKTPYYYGIMLVALFASLGLPGLSGFWGEFFTFRGALALTTGWAIFAAIGIALAAVYILWRILQTVFLGRYEENKISHWTTVTGQHADGPTDMIGFEKLTLWPLVIFIFILGVYPTPLLNYLNGAAVQILTFVKGVL